MLRATRKLFTRACNALWFDLDGPWADRSHPDVEKRSFGFDLVSDSLSPLGGVRKVKFRLLHVRILLDRRLLRA